MKKTAPIAYVLSQYPTISHTFLLREVRALRDLGIEIRVSSIRSPDRARLQLTGEEREEADGAFYVKEAGATRILAWQAAEFSRAPGAYLKGLLYALRLSGGNLKKLPSYLFYFAEAAAIGRRMRAMGLTHLHTHFASTVALLIAKIFPFTYSMTIHGSDEFIDPYGFHLPEKIHAARLVFGISQYGRSQLMRFSHPADWGKILVTPLGIDPGVFKPLARVPKSDFEIICVGRVVPVKGYLILIEACARLLLDGRRLLLRIVGDGPDRPMLQGRVDELRASSSVIFHGGLDRNALLETYKTVDLFALASFAEGVPVVLMEAMAMEIPCIATRVTGVPELIRDGIDGLLVTPSSVDEMAAAIGRMMDDPTLRERLGKAGRQRVLEHYDIHKNICVLAGYLTERVAG